MVALVTRHHTDHYVQTQELIVCMCVWMYSVAFGYVALAPIRIRGNVSISNGVCLQVVVMWFIFDVFACIMAHDEIIVFERNVFCNLPHQKFKCKTHNLHATDADALTTSTHSLPVAGVTVLHVVLVESSVCCMCAVCGWTTGAASFRECFVV